MKFVFPALDSVEFDILAAIDGSDPVAMPPYLVATHDFPEGERADYIEALAAELLSMIEKFPGEVRPHAVKTISTAFREAAEIGIGLDDPQYIFESIKSWDTEAAAHAFSAFPLAIDERTNKRFALEVSENLTYDEGQALYRFATLVTKLIRE